MNKYLVRRRSDFYRVRFLMLSGVITGIVSAVSIAIALHYIDGMFGNAPLGAPLIIVVPYVAPFALFFLIIFGVNAVGTTRIRSVFHSALWGVIVGASSTPIVPLIKPRDCNYKEAMILLAIACGVLAVLSSLGWKWGRVWDRIVHGRRMVIQNGSMCPTCTYSLMGNTSMVCPECGVPYSFDELGTTKAEFEALHRPEG